MFLIRSIKALFQLTIIVCLGLGTLIALSFPYHYDGPLTASEVEAAKSYYAEVYKQPSKEERLSDYETKYLRVAESMAARDDIEGNVRSFVRKFNLQSKAILEIGSGRGYLQDIVDNYTGLDISPNVQRFYHKKFVLGSATALPFADNTFDALWSIWVFEHVQNPEQAFLEARRVVKTGGLLYLYPAWNVPNWVAAGYPVRSYSELDLRGKLAN